MAFGQVFAVRLLKKDIIRWEKMNNPLFYVKRNFNYFGLKFIFEPARPFFYSICNLIFFLCLSSKDFSSWFMQINRTFVIYFQDEKSEKNDLPLADAHVIVYSVTSRRSFLRALDILLLVQKNFRRSAVILVGNKSDLVRVRAVTTDGKYNIVQKKILLFSLKRIPV